MLLFFLSFWDCLHSCYCSTKEKGRENWCYGNSVQTDFESGCYCENSSCCSDTEKYLKTSVMGTQCRQTLRVALIFQAKLVLRELDADGLWEWLLLFKWGKIPENSCCIRELDADRLWKWLLVLLFKQGKIPENWYYGNSVQTVFESRANCSGKTGVTGTECRQTSGFDLILTEFCQHGAAGWWFYCRSLMSSPWSRRAVKSLCLWANHPDPVIFIHR